ncbi:MAG: CopG family transcriptional regulator [Firmicutes bacterium HGW-Firmicutes-5]|nr:MAG: CopG family transcriptional regulator [Firmicutes bacterium HGW-Firmicutes-5]
MENRIGVVGVVIEKDGDIHRINQVLHDHNQIIVGRMGLPNINQREISIISVVVDGTTDQIGSLTGQLGALKGVNVKSALSKKSGNATV